MINLFPSPTPPNHLANGHPGAQCKYAAEQAISEEEAIQKGMDEKYKEFAEARAEVYVPT